MFKKIIILLSLHQLLLLPALMIENMPPLITREKSKIENHIEKQYFLDQRRDEIERLFLKVKSSTINQDIKFNLLESLQSLYLAL